MADVEHISRKGTGVPVSWFPVPDDLRGLFAKAREDRVRPKRLSRLQLQQLHEPTENLQHETRCHSLVEAIHRTRRRLCIVEYGQSGAAGGQYDDEGGEITVGSQGSNNRTPGTGGPKFDVFPLTEDGNCPRPLVKRGGACYP